MSITLLYGGWYIAILQFLVTGFFHSALTNAVYFLLEREEMLPDLGYLLIP